jgi:hypothetical protein
MDTIKWFGLAATLYMIVVFLWFELSPVSSGKAVFWYRNGKPLLILAMLALVFGWPAWVQGLNAPYLTKVLAGLAGWGAGGWWLVRAEKDLKEGLRRHSHLTRMEAGH